MSLTPEDCVRVVMREPESRRWLEFASLVRVLATSDFGEVLPVLRQVEEAVERDGLYAAGSISYEAAPAFDGCLPSKGAGALPLVWFGLFREVHAWEELIPAMESITGEGAKNGAQNGGLADGNVPAPVLPLDWLPSISEPEYTRRLEQIRECIRRGETYQVNFTYRLRARTTAQPWALFAELLAGEEVPYAAFIETGSWALCSASPELFLRRDGERLESRPMKGTAARGLWLEDDLAKAAALRASEKERAENVMIIDMARNDLGRVALPGSVMVRKPFEVERHPTTWQMTSTVEARTLASFTDILRATFPPASVTGAPKRRTMEIIADLETSPRGVYTGAIGFLAPGRHAQFNVAIRTVVIDKHSGRMEYGVGGGIVWDSEPDKERQECRIKAKVLHQAPRDFDLLETMRWSPRTGYWLLEFHLKRLVESAQYFGFALDLEAARNELARHAATFGPGRYRLRLLVSRRGALRCEAAPLEHSSGDVGRVRLAVEPIDSANVFLYHKTTERTAYGEARNLNAGCDDVLLFNESGELTETTVGNVAFELGGELYTPPLRCGLLPGTCRAWLLGRRKLREGVVTVEQAHTARVAYVFNSVRGIRRLRLMAAGAYGPLLPAL